MHLKILNVFSHDAIIRKYRSHALSLTEYGKVRFLEKQAYD